MIDFAKITVKAGDGGNGAGSFMHIKGKRRGKADGGDGGVGGSVYFVATANLNTLEPFRFIKDYKAQNGGNGFSNRRTGAGGRDLEIKVPMGTTVKILDDRSKMIDDNNKVQHPESIVYDLVRDGDKILVVRGGEGGRGNCHLRDEFGRRPFRGEKGEVGEQVALTLELKLIADVGLVGLPNAGKSTLIAALTSARPKIADYPFTTLEPNLGVIIVGPAGLYSTPTSSLESKVNQNQSSSDAAGARVGTPRPSPAIGGRRLVMADIPGLIAGASQGKGLGDLFLRHIERTKILVHLIDVSQAADLWKNYLAIRNELKVYSKDLAKKKEIIVFNKADLVGAVACKERVADFARHRKAAIAISAKEGRGLDELVGAMYLKLKA